MAEEIVVNEELVQNYARVKGVSLDEARTKLKENMIKEASVDLRQQMTTLMNAFRKMSPQLNGIISRESDYANGIKALGLKIKSIEKENEALRKRLDFERDAYSKSMSLLTGIVKEDEKTQARITALEASSLPLYKRVFNRIKCLLNS
jgi:hypothetical protein